MIKNFNFYDIYGYFLPGLVLLTLLAIPVLVIERRWPSAEIGSAIAFLALAYIAGHILQTVAAVGIPSFRLTRVKYEFVMRFPSDRFLDSSDSTFSSDFKTNIARKILVFFGLSVSIGKQIANCTAEELRRIGKQRQEAFFLCRSVLVANKKNVYGEQFEGMYTLMRGLTAAFGFGAFYFLGWGLATEFPGFREKAIPFAGVMLFLAFIVAAASILPPEISEKRKVAGYMILITLLLATTAIGSVGAFYQEKAGSISGVLWVITLCSALASIRSYSSFRVFTEEFAKAIYRDFYVYERDSKSGGKAEQQNNE